MKKVGVLGGTGAIGKRVLEILDKDYELFASYHKNQPDRNRNALFTQLDIMNRNELKSFCQNCDAIVNCAGASYLNGEIIAQVAAELNIPLIDPSGESFLEDKLFSTNDKNIFVLSSGCFPGMTGILMNYLCLKMDQVIEMSGMSISTEIPSISAIEDFILTGTTGFGMPLKYYENGEFKRDHREIADEIIINNQKFTLQTYYNVELDRLVKKYRPDKANWFNAIFNNEIMQNMQKAIIVYNSNKSMQEFNRISHKIQQIFINNQDTSQPFNYLQINVEGIKNGSRICQKAEIHNDSSSMISAITAAYAVNAVLNNSIANGIYYAMDIINPESVIAGMLEQNIDINISQEIMGVNDYEEGFI